MSDFTTIKEALEKAHIKLCRMEHEGAPCETARAHKALDRLEQRHGAVVAALRAMVEGWMKQYHTTASGDFASCRFCEALIESPQPNITVRGHRSDCPALAARAALEAE